MQRVAVIGASTKPDRYAYKAVALLQEKGHTPVPIAPAKKEVQGLKAYGSIAEVSEPVDTVTIYVRPKVLEELADDIIAAQPKRIIMNPGTEDDRLKQRFEDAGISVVQACTLVMLSTGQF